MKRICIVMAGNFSGLSTEVGLKNGFEKLGINLFQVDRSDYCAHSSSYWSRIWSRLSMSVSIQHYNSAIINAVEKSKPRFFITVKGSYITAQTLSHIQKLGVLTVNYYPDFHFAHPGLQESDFCCYDLFITTKSFQVDYLTRKLGAKRVAFLHHGYVAGFHQPPKTGTSKITSDIVYIGSHSSEKEEWLRAIKKEFPKADFKIFGSRWSSIRNKGILEPSIMGRPVYGQEFAETIFTARINLAVHMGALGPHGWADLVSTRTFEIPACKGFMLHVDNHEVRQLFNPVEEIDVFNNIEELCQKIEFYLTHDSKRREMLERAYQRCVPAYSYDERARVLVELLSQKDGLVSEIK